MKKIDITNTVFAAAFFLIFTQGGALGGEDRNDFRFEYGGDLRLRQEIFDNIPVMTETPSVTRGGNNNYFRLRARVWGVATFWDKIIFKVRATDEIRHNLTGPESYEFPDELIFDNLYLEFRDIFGDGVVLRGGRQDLTLGSGRLFADGTAKDGSRSSYFDGLYFAAPVFDKSKLTAFAFYTECEDDLAIGNLHRDVTGYGSGINGMGEGTAGLYYEDREYDGAGFDLYGIWKHDTAWMKGDVRVPADEIYTVGIRLLPRFSDTVSGELEFAYQFGDQDGISRSSMLGFAGLTYLIDKESNFTISLNGLYLSGDDPSSKQNEGYNPLFGRFPWVSEAMIFAYDQDGVGFWNNLIFGYIEAAVSPIENHRLSVVFGQMGADENNGAGGGYNRGLFARAKYGLALNKQVSTYLLGEMLCPGDYYISDKTAYFIRWEIGINF